MINADDVNKIVDKFSNDLRKVLQDILSSGTAPKEKSYTFTPADTDTQMFCKWMQSQGAWGKFCENCLRENDSISFYNIDVYRFVSDSFSWMSSPEGFEYWTRLNSDWCVYLGELNEVNNESV